MANEPDTPVTPATSDTAARSLVADVRQLVTDGKTLIEAELAFQKSRIAVTGSGAKTIAAWAAMTLALAFFSLMALVMGVLLALGHMIGFWAATGAVVLLLLLSTGGCAWAAWRRWLRLSRLLAEKGDKP
ncbi:MAG: phage holin family protein [Proteobacteria bacterium]|nr:phage holin family protein [Pseudomonadota bacterium]